MSHKLIPLDTLSIQPDYNIRTDSDVKHNAKEVAQAMEAQGDKPELFPVRFVTIDGQKYTRNHATLLAAQLRGWKEIYAAKAPFEAGTIADELDLVFSNNGGHPLNRVQQGKIYARLRDGIQEDQSEAIKNAGVGEEVPVKWLREPMTEQQIGDACKPRYSSEHIRQCIAIYESSPEVAALIEEDKVALNIVVRAAQLAKGDDAKQLKILRKAISAAKDDGKDKATQKHLDAIKDEFTAPKKLVAAPVEQEQKPDAVADSPAIERQETTNAGSTPAHEPDLIPHDVSPVRPKDARKALITIITKCRVLHNESMQKLIYIYSEPSYSPSIDK